jgi:S1-C subfamily serine protease
MKLMKLIVVIFLLFVLSLFISNIHPVSEDNEFVVVSDNDTISAENATVCTIVINDVSSGIEGFSSSGYGTLINNQPVIITVSHTFEKSDIEGFTVKDECKKQDDIDVKNLYRNKIMDITVMETESGVDKIYNYSDSPPKKGEKVTYYGYRDSELLIGSGVVNKTEYSVDSGPPFGLFTVDTEDSIKKGMSGGPIISEDKKIKGLIVARKNGSLIGVKGTMIEGISREMEKSEESYEVPDFPFEISDNIISKDNQRSVIITEVDEEYIGELNTPRMVTENSNSTKYYGYGDTITHINNRRIESTNEAYNYIIKEHSSGDNIYLTIRNDGNVRRERIELGSASGE